MSKNVEASDDKVLLKVRGNIDDRDERKIYVKQLSQALFTVIQKHGVARLRCVGAAAVMNAVKAQIIANGEASKKGISLYASPSFKSIVIGNAGEKTSIVLEIKPM